jgi:hypothetical protein
MAVITVRQNGSYKIEGDDVKLVERQRVHDSEAPVFVVPVRRVDE